MTNGSRWLLAALAGGALALPAGPAAAQAGEGGPSAPAETRPGQQAYYQKPPPIRAGSPITVLFFPFGYAGDDDVNEAPAAATPAEGATVATQPTAPQSQLTTEQQELLSYASAALKAALLSTPTYSVASYHPQAALVQRALQQEILRREHVLDVVSPRSGAVRLARARFIGERLTMQTILVGTLDVKADVEANSAEVTMHVQLVHTTSGEVLRNAAASGAAQGAAGVSLLAVEQRAALDAAQKLLPGLGIDLVPLPSSDAAPAAAPARNSKRAKPEKSEKQEKPARSGRSEPAAPAAEQTSASPAAAEASPAVAAAPARDAARLERERSRELERQARIRERETERAAAAAREEQRRAERQAARTRRQPEKPVAALADQQPASAPDTDGIGAPPAGRVLIPNAQGTANAAGQPVPYGYALGEVTTALPPPSRQGLRVPAWLGVAAFLTGISFLL